MHATTPSTNQSTSASDTPTRSIAMPVLALCVPTLSIAPTPVTTQASQMSALASSMASQGIPIPTKDSDSDVPTQSRQPTSIPRITTERSKSPEAVKATYVSQQNQPTSVSYVATYNNTYTPTSGVPILPNTPSTITQSGTPSTVTIITTVTPSTNAGVLNRPLKRLILFFGIVLVQFVLP